MKIRTVTEFDAEQMVAIYAPIVRDTAISFEIEPPDRKEIISRLRLYTAKYPWLVAEKDGKVIGYAYGWTHHPRAAYRWSVNVSVYIHPDFRNQGVGKALYTELFAKLRELGYQSLFAGIALPNPGSVALHESLGFKQIGVYPRVGHKFGKWHDVGWWGMSVGEFEDSPQEPKPFTTK